ncbi:N-acetylmuramoyl-L-alanine amidase [candidate division KSB1 bacterium]
MKYRIYILLLSFLSAAALWYDAAEAQRIKVIVERVPARIDYLSSLQTNIDYFVSAEELASILEVNTYIDEQLGKIVLYLDGTQVTFTADNPFIMVGETLYQMPVEVMDFRSELYIPLQEVLPILNNLPGDYTFDPGERIFTVYPGDELNITDIAVEEKSNGTLIRIRTLRDFTGKIQEWFDKDKYHLTLSFFKGRLDTLNMTNTDTRGLVLRNMAFQFPESAQITFRLSRYTENYHLEYNKDANEILISLMRTGAVPVAPPPVDPEEFVDIKTDDIITKDKESWIIDTIVIDPGHGGKDPGTIYEDMREKDIVLNICRHLKTLLEQSELFKKVVLTREQDVFIPLKERSEIAKDMNGKLFVSVHVNSSKNTRIRGFETYFLRPGMNEDALEVLEVVQRENNVIRLYEDADPERELTEEEKMMLAITQSAFVEESKMLAEKVSEGIGRKVKWPDRGIKQAGFLVLWRVPMPNVLVEVGFMSNLSQRNDLKTRAIQHRIAEGIFEGIKRFKEEVRR